MGKVSLTLLGIFLLVMHSPGTIYSEDKDLWVQLQQALEEISRLRADLEKIKDQLNQEGEGMAQNTVKDLQVRVGKSSAMGRRNAAGDGAPASCVQTCKSISFGNTTYDFAGYLSSGLESSCWKVCYKTDPDGDDMGLQRSWVLSF